MATNPKFLKKNILATSALTAIIMTATAGSALAVNRDTVGAGTSAFSTATNWAPNGPVQDNDNLKIHANGHGITVDIADLNVTINLDGKTGGSELLLNENLLLGSVFGKGAAAVDVINAKFGAASKSLTLTGKGTAANTDANDYSALGSVDFDSKPNAHFTVDNPNHNYADAIANPSDNSKFTVLPASFENSANDTKISILTPTVATYNAADSLKTILGKGGGVAGTVNIGAIGQASVLVVKPTGGAVAGIPATIAQQVEFLHQDSVLGLDATNAAGALTFTLNGKNLGAPAAAEGTGILELNATNKAIELKANGGETIGDSGRRLKGILIEGDQDVKITAQIFAKEIDASKFNSAGKTLTFGKLGGTTNAENDRVEGLNALNAKATALGETTYVSTFLFAGEGNENATLKLTSAVDSQHKIIDLSHANNGGVLVIDGNNTTILKGSKLSAEDNKLNKVDFATDNTLNLEDGVNIYTANGFEAATSGHGTLSTKGSLTIDGKIGTNNKLKAITADVMPAGTPAVLKVLNDVNISNSITAVSAGTTVQLGGANIVAGVAAGGAPVAALAGLGTVEFVNSQATTVTSGASIVEKLKFSGANVTLPAVRFATKTMEFGTQATTVTLDGAGALITLPNNFTLTTASTARNQNIEISDDLTIDNTAKIATKENPFGNFELTDDKTFTVETANFHAGAVTKTHEKAKFIANAANINIKNIGTSDKHFGFAEFIDDARVEESYAKKHEVADTKKVTFVKKVSGNEGIKLMATADNDTSVIFEDGIEVDTPITTLTANCGKVIFKGGSTVTKNAKFDTLPRSVKFEDENNNTQHILTDAIKAQEINFGKTIVSVEAPRVTLEGATGTAKGTTYNLYSNELGIKNIKTLTGNIEYITVFNGNTIGSIVLDGGETQAKVDATGVNEFTIRLIDNKAAELPDQGGDEYHFVKTENGADLKQILIPADTNKLNVILPEEGTTGLVRWTYESEKYIFRRIDDSMRIAKEILSKLDTPDYIIASVSQLMDKTVTAETLALKKNLHNILMKDKDAFKDTIQRVVTDNGQANTAVVNNVAEVSNTSIAQRMLATYPGNVTGQSKSDILATPAGDEQKYARYGVWGNPFYNQSKQKHKGALDGYKAKSVGGTIGFDTMANDTMTVGLAATYARTNVKHKDLHLGDKTKINSYLFSIYGNQLICDDYFVSAVATFGSHKVKENSLRYSFADGSIVNQKAHASYDIMTWGGEVLAGYHYRAMESTVIIPTIGVSYNRFNDIGYTEKGTNNQNRTITKKPYNRVEAVAGLKAIGGAEINNIAYTPEVHGYIRQALSNKSPKTEIRLNGMASPITPKAAKISKTSGTLGGSVTIQSGIMDYSLGYDLHLAKKYVGHQGTVKVRVNF